MSHSTGRPLLDFMDLLLDAVCVVNAQGRFVFVSAACEQLFGYTPEEMVGRKMLDMVHPEDRETTLAMATRVQAGELVRGYENRYLHRDGHVVHVLWSARLSERDQLRIAVAHDISERKRAEMLQATLFAISEAAHDAEDLPTLFAQIHRIVGTLLPAANFFVALYDEESELLSFPYFVDAFDTPPPPCRLDSGTLSAEVVRSGKALLLTADTEHSPLGEERPVTGTPAVDWLGVPLKHGKRSIGALVVQSYTTAVRYSDHDKQLLQFVSTQVAAAIVRTQLFARLLHAAGHDNLTGLANRALFEDRFNTVLARARREQTRFALLYIDLDRFKGVNDSHGHATGDRVLQEVAQRLQRGMRESDTVARIGGDEFVVLLTGLVRPEHAGQVAEKIRGSLSEAHRLGELSLICPPSIGIAVYPDDGNSLETLLHHADTAMYSSKKSGL